MIYGKCALVPQPQLSSSIIGNVVNPDLENEPILAYADG